MTELNNDIATRFARAALGHVGREWPNKLDHVMAGPEDVQRPRALHPVFFGSFDWHSCVHGYWLLARLYRRLPQLHERDAIRALFDRRLTAENVAAEVAYLARPESRGFERAYGWAWALMLAGELAQHETAEGKRWGTALRSSNASRTGSRAPPIRSALACTRTPLSRFCLHRIMRNASAIPRSACC
jgi:hypothetical protein